jgi:NAD(P)-dependent dehydrogenase (short-subunit alcohol dehydrogenase family)
MSRRIVVTGSASGIGAATAQRLRAAGEEVIGVDLHNADVIADLSTASGRSGLLPAVTRLAGNSIDALIAAAGVEDGNWRSVAVNYFGAVATMDSLRVLLARGREPRAVLVASTAVAHNQSKLLAEMCLAGDETTARAMADAQPDCAYTASKAAVALWMRRSARTPAWAGAGILLNAIAPGLVLTPMGHRALKIPRVAEMFKEPLALGRYAQPQEIAAVLEFLVSPANSYMVGQVVFVDGGVDASLRADHM